MTTKGSFLRNGFVFSRTPAGRAFCATLAWTVLGPVVLYGSMASGPRADVLLAILVLGCIVGGIFSVGLATTSRPAWALALLIGLPLAGGPYFVALHGAARLGMAGAVLLSVLGSALAAMAFWPQPSRR